MKKERRHSTLNDVLLTLGEIVTISRNNSILIKELKDRVGIQNSRVRSLEHFKSYSSGALAVLVVMIIPILIHLIPDLLRVVFHNG